MGRHAFEEVARVAGEESTATEDGADHLYDLEVLGQELAAIGFGIDRSGAGTDGVRDIASLTERFCLAEGSNHSQWGD